MKNKITEPNLQIRLGLIPVWQGLMSGNQTFIDELVNVDVKEINRLFEEFGDNS